MAAYLISRVTSRFSVATPRLAIISHCITSMKTLSSCSTSEASWLTVFRDGRRPVTYQVNQNYICEKANNAVALETIVYFSSHGLL